MVAESSSLQRIGLQRGERYPGPWTGRIILHHFVLNRCFPAAPMSNNSSVGTVKKGNTLSRQRVLLWPSPCCHGEMSYLCKVEKNVFLLSNCCVFPVLWQCQDRNLPFFIMSIPEVLDDCVFSVNFITSASSNHVLLLDFFQNFRFTPLWPETMLPS